MTAGLIFAIGTLAAWIGWASLLRVIFLAVRLAVSRIGDDRLAIQRSLIGSAIVAGIGILLSQTLPMGLDRPAPPSQAGLPIVWFAMGVFSWLAFIGGVMTFLRLGQGWLALSKPEGKERFRAGTYWAIFTAACVGLQITYGQPVTIIRGRIGMSFPTAIALLVLAAGAIVAMAYAGRQVKSRGIATGVTIHLSLLVGCVVFGLPFAWLLITSFKEDRDLAAINGIVWIPKVSETLPYLDPKNPRFEAEFKGSTVIAQRVQELSPTTWQMEVFEPLGIRGTTFEAAPSALKEVPKQVPVVTGEFGGKHIRGMVVEELDGGDRRVQVLEPADLKGVEYVAKGSDVEAVRHPGLNFKNYPDSLAYLPPETQFGLVYLKNTLIIVILSVIGTLISCSLVAYAFSRMRFPGRNQMFAVLLSTMMLPGAVTLLPTFLIYRQFGWIDTLYPLWVPAFFAGAFNVFLLRQFFMGIPMELEDAAKIDGCTYWRTYWQVMLPQVKPALAAIAIWTFMGSWNNFMGPLIYINSPENMPVAYAVQLFQGQRGGDQHLMMAFATMSIVPVLALFFFAQKYFIEGVTLSGLGGR